MTRWWREADLNFESLSESVPLAPGQMIGKSRADGGKILEQLGSWGGILSASIRMPMSRRSGKALRDERVSEIDLRPSSTAPSEEGMPPAEWRSR